MIEPQSQQYDGAISALERGFRLRCPACGRGRLFRNLFYMHERCGHCGVRFEREEGQFTGAVYVNLILTELGMGVLFLGLEYFYDLPVWQVIAILGTWTIVFPVFFFRHTKGFWAGMVHLSRGLTPDEPTTGGP